MQRTRRKFDIDHLPYSRNKTIYIVQRKTEMGEAMALALLSFPWLCLYL
jgi:hypothetical protein